jgi:hypothetical protein
VSRARLDSSSRRTRGTSSSWRSISSFTWATTRIRPSRTSTCAASCSPTRSTSAGSIPDRTLRARTLFGRARGAPDARDFGIFHGTPLVVVTPWKSIDIDLFVPGYRAVLLQDLGEHAEVELEPGLPVRLRLANDVVLPEPPRYLKAVLEPPEVAGLGIDWAGPAFGAEREIRITAFGSGRMLVRWIVETVQEDGRGGGASWVQPPQFVDVRETAELQTFEVTISAAELARILREAE